jgi:hypothetical protein
MVNTRAIPEQKNSDSHRMLFMQILAAMEAAHFAASDDHIRERGLGSPIDLLPQDNHSILSLRIRTAGMKSEQLHASSPTFHFYWLYRRTTTPSGLPPGGILTSREMECWNYLW